MSEASQREIKVPPAQIWREFRMRFLPVGAFVAMLVVATLLWRQTVIGPTMVGEVEAIQTAIVTPEAGYITNLYVHRLQVVKAGDPIAEVISTDVRAASSEVQDLRSRIALSQLEINSIIDRERIAFDYQALSMNTLRYRAELGAARAELPTLEAALKRAEEGWNARVVPYNDYELALRTRDSFKARIEEYARLVSESEQRLAEAKATANVFTNIGSATLPEAIKRIQDDRAEMASSRSDPIVLRAPIDGTIGIIMRRAGENVVAGEPIVYIHAMTGDRIITYVRQGTMMEPKKGMPVRIRCRTIAREEAIGHVEEVGHRFESITNQALLRPGMLFELGMPVGVNMPQSLRAILRPGEVVDLSIEQ
jgi:multidrug resistance efflux pump